MTATIQSVQASLLTCVRGGRAIFRDVGFTLKSGAMLALEGPNGAGKTSLLRMLAGFLAPAAGSIRIQSDGRDIADADERGKLVGWLGHQDGVKPQMTPRESLCFFAKLYGQSALPQGEGSIDAALSDAGLAHVADLPCQYHSAGQKKRLALARLVISGRPLWLMDEPLAALDSAGKTLVAECVTAHCRAGGIAVIATHEPLALDCARLALA